MAVTEGYELVERLLDTLDVARDVLCAPTSMRPSMTLPCTLTKSIDQAAQHTMGRAKRRGEERKGEERREERRGGERSGEEESSEERRQGPLESILREASLPDGSPTLVVPPPSRMMGLCPHCCRCRNIMICSSDLLLPQHPQRASHATAHAWEHGRGIQQAFASVWSLFNRSRARRRREQALATPHASGHPTCLQGAGKRRQQEGVRGKEGGRGSDPTWREEAVASKPRYAVTCPASIFLSSSPMSVHE